jgi:hypothetical protein
MVATVSASTDRGLFLPHGNLTHPVILSAAFRAKNLHFPCHVASFSLKNLP